MQHLLIRTAKGLELVLFVLNWLFNICVAILSVACISTYLYRITTYRSEWATFMGISLQGIILFAVLTVAECILIHFVKGSSKTVILSCESAKKRGRSLGRESNILGIVFFVSTTVGRLIKSGKVQGLTNDFWVASVYITLFLSQIFFLACKFLFASYVYIRIVESDSNLSE